MDSGRPVDPRVDPRVARLVRAVRNSFDASQEAVLALDEDGRRLYSNAAFDALVGLDGETLEGQRPPYPYWEAASTPRMLEQLQAMLDGRLEQLGVRAVMGRFAPDGQEPFDVVMVGHQLRDASGVSLLNLCSIKRIDADDTVAIARWLAHNLALQRFRDAVLRLDGVVDVLSEPSAPASPAAPRRLDALPGWDSLTSREREVLSRVVEGLRVTHIAQDLGIQAATVRNHLKAVFRKTGLHSQARLVEVARRLGRTGAAA